AKRAVQPLQRDVGAADVDTLRLEVDLAAQVRAKQRAFDIRLLQYELPIPARNGGAHLVELEDFARHIPASADCRPALVGAADDLTYDRVTEHLEVLNPQRSLFFCSPRAIEINFETQPSALHVGIETDELQHLPRIA